MAKRKPIPFTNDMVCALLGREKTQTRRLMRPQPPEGHVRGPFVVCSTDKSIDGKLLFDDPRNSSKRFAVKPPYREGDKLYVKETWRLCNRDGQQSGDLTHIRYRADGAVVPCQSIPEDYDTSRQLGRWRPGRFMPEWASRIELTSKVVRAQKLWDITEAEAQAEGVVRAFVMSIEDFVGKKPVESTYKLGFLNAFEVMNKDRMTCRNPWVWVIEFEVSSVRVATGYAEVDWEVER